MPRQPGPLSIDLSGLSIALEDHSGLEWFLDTETGEVVPINDGTDIADLPGPLDNLVESGRLLHIDPLASHESWEAMSGFAAELADPHLRELLEVALSGKGAFGRFKAVLAAHPEQRQQWFAAREAWLESECRPWLPGRCRRPRSRNTSARPARGCRPGRVQVTMGEIVTCPCRRHRRSRGRHHRRPLTWTSSSASRPPSPRW